MSYIESHLSNKPKQVFFNPINIFDTFTHSITLLYIFNKFFSFNVNFLILQVGKFGKDKDAFVQLKLAKLVVVRNTKATTQHPIVEAVMAFTEAFVEE